MRLIKKHPVVLTESLKKQILNWAQQFEEVIWMDSNSHSDQHGRYQAILAVDALTSIKTDFHSSFKELEEYQSTIKDWLFGYLTYDLKNDLEDLDSNNMDVLEFPDLFFFR